MGKHSVSVPTLRFQELPSRCLLSVVVPHVHCRHGSTPSLLSRRWNRCTLMSWRRRSTSSWRTSSPSPSLSRGARTRDYRCSSATPGTLGSLAFSYFLLSHRMQDLLSTFLYMTCYWYEQSVFSCTKKKRLKFNKLNRLVYCLIWHSYFLRFLRNYHLILPTLLTFSGKEAEMLTLM